VAQRTTRAAERVRHLCGLMTQCTSDSGGSRAGERFANQARVDRDVKPGMCDFNVVDDDVYQIFARKARKATSLTMPVGCIAVQPVRITEW
jgi:hypothetical protein